MAPRLAGALADIFPASVHVGNIDLAGASDLLIWQHARDNGFVLVSKDADFQSLSILYGAPPKVIWLRLGNCSTEDIIRLLRTSREEINAFVQHEEAGLLALGAPYV